MKRLATFTFAAMILFVVGCAERVVVKDHDHRRPPPRPVEKTVIKVK